MRLTSMLLIGALFVQTGCATAGRTAGEAPGTLMGETVGEKFRKVLAHIDTRCKELKMGPYYDPSDSESRRMASGTDCDILKVKPFDLNAILATPEGQFAYSIKLPPPLDKPRVSRKDYSSARSYFEALCQKEAGDYVFSTAQDVQGIAVLRTPPRPGGQPLGSFSEETTGPTGGPTPENLLVSAPQYILVERPSRNDEVNEARGALTRRYSRDPTRPVVFPSYGLKFELLEKPSVRYGLLWRGTTELDDRENGIIGGELMIIDRESNKVLAVRRAFTIDEVDTTKEDHVRFWSLSCPGVVATDGFDLINKVLRLKTSEGGMR